MPIVPAGVPLWDIAISTVAVFAAASVVCAVVVAAVVADVLFSAFAAGFAEPAPLCRVAAVVEGFAVVSVAFAEVVEGTTVVEAPAFVARAVVVLPALVVLCRFVLCAVEDLTVVV